MKLTKKNVRIALGAILAAMLILVIVQNSSQVALRFITWRLEMPLFIVVLLSSLTGLAIGWLLKAKRH